MARNTDWCHANYAEPSWCQHRPRQPWQCQLWRISEIKNLTKWLIKSKLTKIKSRFPSFSLFSFGAFHFCGLPSAKMMKVTVSTMRITMVMIQTFLHLETLPSSPLIMELAIVGATNPGMEPMQFVSPNTVPTLHILKLTFYNYCSNTSKIRSNVLRVCDKAWVESSHTGHTQGEHSQGEVHLGLLIGHEDHDH